MSRLAWAAGCCLRGSAPDCRQLIRDMHTEEEKSEALRCVWEDDGMVKLTSQVGEETGVGTGRETSGVYWCYFWSSHL